MDFDIVIPVGPNEVKNICTQIEYVKKNVQGFRRIFVVSYDASIVLDGCTVICEDIFPFKMEYISNYFFKHYGKSNRNGWYFQQLLKLYAGQVIPDILPHYLVIDADVFFLKPLSFFSPINDISGTNKILQYCFTIGTEHHVPYFEHMEQLHPNFKKISEYSGISHHMMFSTEYVKEMMHMVEEYHSNSLHIYNGTDEVIEGQVPINELNIKSQRDLIVWRKDTCHILHLHNDIKSNTPFWQIFIDSVKEHLKYWPKQTESGASEYELYFNYMLQYHADLVCSRTLKWENVSSQFTSLKNSNHSAVESLTNLPVTDFTPFCIENAQSVSPSSLITATIPFVATEGGVFQQSKYDKMCNIEPLQGSDSNLHWYNIANAYSHLDYVSVLWYCN